MPNDRDDAVVAHEVLGNRDCLLAIALVIAKNDLQRPVACRIAPVDLGDSQLDAAAVHLSVAGFPWSGGADDDGPGPSFAAGKQGDHAKDSRGDNESSTLESSTLG